MLTVGLINHTGKLERKRLQGELRLLVSTEQERDYYKKELGKYQCTNDGPFRSSPPAEESKPRAHPRGDNEFLPIEFTAAPLESIENIFENSRTSLTGVDLSQIDEASLFSLKCSQIDMHKRMKDNCHDMKRWNIASQIRVRGRKLRGK